MVQGWLLQSRIWTESIPLQNLKVHFSKCAESSKWILHYFSLRNNSSSGPVIYKEAGRKTHVRFVPMTLDNSITIFNSSRWFFIAPYGGILHQTRNWKGGGSLTKSPWVRHTPVDSPHLLRGAATLTTRPHRGATSLMGLSSSSSRFFYDFCNWSWGRNGAQRVVRRSRQAALC